MRRDKVSIQGGMPGIRPSQRFTKNNLIESDIAETIDNCKVIHQKVPAHKYHQDSIFSESEKFRKKLSRSKLSHSKATKTLSGYQIKDDNESSMSERTQL